MDQRYRPVIFVRGFAPTRGVIRDIVADPFMGFNNGSTYTRRDRFSERKREVFESLVIRMIEDHGYAASFRRLDVNEDSAFPKRPLVVQRYYDVEGSRPHQGPHLPIEAYAAHLAELILEVSTAHAEVVGRRQSKVYIVAHSMGGLVCRTLLQNDRVAEYLPRKALDLIRARQLVDKVVTFGTPHGGIHLNVLGNPPDLPFFPFADNFNISHMRDFLDLPKDTDPSELAGRFPADRMLCVAGTNSSDYGVLRGLSHNLIGRRSDGLVRWKHAIAHDRGPCLDRPVEFSPSTFVHRSHGGAFGLTSGEASYEALETFLFGRVRVTGDLRFLQGKDKPETRATIETLVSQNRVDAPVHIRTKRNDAEIELKGSEAEPFLAGEPLRLFTLFGRIPGQEAPSYRSPVKVELTYPEQDGVRGRLPWTRCSVEARGEAMFAVLDNGKGGFELVDPEGRKAKESMEFVLWTGEDGAKLVLTLTLSPWH